MDFQPSATFILKGYKMQVIPIHTHAVTPEDTLENLIDSYVKDFQPGSILAITSKIISICENRIVPVSQAPCKQELIIQEADAYLLGDYQEKYGHCLTIKNGMLIPSAGIDQSNGNDHYILYPHDCFAAAKQVWQHLRQRINDAPCGVIVTDSHTIPLRRGVIGICLAWCGFNPLYNYINKQDIFGKRLRVTMSNYADALSVASVFAMGEGNEQTPMAIISDLQKIKFCENPPTNEEIDVFYISMEDDLYAPLLTAVNWQTKTNN